MEFTTNVYEHADPALRRGREGGSEDALVSSVAVGVAAPHATALVEESNRAGVSFAGPGRYFYHISLINQ